MTPTRPPIQRGFSLVEMLTTITIMTVLLALCAGMIKLLLRLDHSGRDALAVTTDRDRLARTFRDDAHRSATRTLPTVAADRIGWSLPDGARVEYSIRPDDTLRELTRDGKVRQREIYRRPPRASVRFEAAVEATRPLVSVVVHRDPSGNLPVLDDRIDAELGRIDRLIAREP